MKPFLKRQITSQLMTAARQGVRLTGFTLAELLIALAILGVIATFTIPKVLSSSLNSQHNAVAKEAIAAMSGAYQAYLSDNGGVPSSTFSATLLTPYLNYVKTGATTESIDNHYANSSTLSCDPGAPAGGYCYKLHNGSTILIYNTQLAGTANTNAVYFYFDPDGRASSPAVTDGPGMALVFFLYANGRITDYGSIPNTTTSQYGLHSSCPGCNPPWFSW